MRSGGDVRDRRDQRVVVLTPVLRAVGAAEGKDSTHPTDYRVDADAGDPGVKDLPDLVEEGPARS